MSVRCRISMIAGIAIAALWAAPGGVKPRPSQSDYPARATTAEGATIAADLLSPAEVKNAFSTDLNRAWLVVEVAVYPAGKGQIAIEKSDFWLQVTSGGERTALRAADARTIAGVLSRKSQPRDDSDVTLYPTVGVGYGSGPAGYDPVTGSRVGGGWHTAVGVGVGLGKQNGGPPRPASTEKDRETMELELGDMGLASGLVTQPAAGFLYFPVPAKKLKNPTYELEYHGPSGVRRIAFPRTGG